MRCRDAREWLSAQRDGGFESSQAQAVQEHLQGCPTCCAYDQRQRQLDAVISSLGKTTQATPLMQASSISTDRIMRAVQQQKKITEQLENIQQQQQTRVARMRKVGAASAALGLFTLSSIPLLFLTVTIIQTDLALKTLSLLNGVIDAAIILGQYLQTGLSLVTRDNLTLSGVAFAVVVMMGMWLHLMRSPHEA